MRARICRECFSNGEVLPPLRMGSKVPFSRKRLQTGSPGELVKTPASDRVADALDLPAAAERIS
jgi:hypothetical protein